MARRRLIPIFADIDHRHYILGAWIETAWHALHDGRPPDAGRLSLASDCGLEIA
jgi:hypothetical protein